MHFWQISGTLRIQTFISGLKTRLRIEAKFNDAIPKFHTNSNKVFSFQIIF